MFSKGFGLALPLAFIHPDQGTGVVIHTLKRRGMPFLNMNSDGRFNGKRVAALGVKLTTATLCKKRLSDLD